MASRTVTVEVTEQDILAGEPGNAISCPVAYAVNRVLRSRYRARVYVEQIGLYLVGRPMKPLYEIPANNRVFIGEFDRGFSVHPFTFSLDLPEEVLA